MTTPSGPLVTFALIAYKQEAFIREAVAGALAQGYTPLEIILSDDCSPDQTFLIMQEMAAAYKGPHTVILNRNETNLGLGAHVNRIMEIAKGELIVAPAGDDISLPARTERLVREWLGNGKPSAMCSGFDCIDEQGRILKDLTRRLLPSPPSPDEPPRVCLRRFALERRYSLSGCSEAWAARLFEEFGPLDADPSLAACILLRVHAQVPQGAR